MAQGWNYMDSNGEITFDILDLDEDDNDSVEGCYRLESEDWKIFYFSHRMNGELWKAEPYIRPDATWPNGVKGIDVVYPVDRPLNKNTVRDLLSDILGKNIRWAEVHGPDSLQLK